MEKFVLIPQSMWKEWVNTPRFAPKPFQRTPVKQVDPPDKSELPISLEKDQYTRLSNTLQTTKLIKILDQLLRSDRIDISGGDTIILDEHDTNISVVKFIRAVGQSPLREKRKQSKIPGNYRPIIDVLSLTSDLLTNPNAFKSPATGWSDYTF